MDSPLVENQGIEERLFNAISNTIKSVPSYQELGINVIRLCPGKSFMKILIDRPELGNNLGGVHGGIIAAVSDIAMGLTAYSLNFRIVTMDLNINYIAPVNLGEEIIAKGYAIHAGKKSVVAEAGFYNINNKLVAKSRGTFLITKYFIVY